MCVCINTRESKECSQSCLSLFLSEKGVCLEGERERVETYEVSLSDRKVQVLQRKV